MLRDLKLAFRQIRRSPGFFAPAILLIALGIAVNTQIFSLVDAVLLRQLPVRDPGSLVQLYEIYPGRPAYPFFDYGLLRELREHASTLADVIGQFEMTAPLERNGTAERIHPERVTDEFFRTLGVSAALGRTLTDGDDHVAVLSYACWKSTFGGDPKAVGQTVRLFNRPFTIVGIAPEAFTGIVIDTASDLWIPMRSSYNFRDDPKVQVNDTYIDNSGMEIVARVRPGATLAQAQAEAALFRDRYNQKSASQRDQGRLEVRSIARGTSPLRDQSATALWLLLAGGALLMLMVSANVGSLMLARASAREKETAIMLALGASRSRISRLWLAEGFILAASGAVLGTWAAWQTLPLWVHWLPPARGVGLDAAEIRTRALDLHPDLRIISFQIAVCALVILFSSPGPALRSSRQDLWNGLRIGIGDARHRRFQSVLCALQVALCTLLLVFAGLVIHSLLGLRGVNMGFEAAHVAVFTVDPYTARYGKQQTEILQRRLIEGARALPGVEAAAIASRPLMHGIGLGNIAVFPDRKPDVSLNTSVNTVSPDYFETMGIQIVAGHGFDPRDQTRPKPGPAVVNQAFVRRFFAGRNPIGQVFATGKKWTTPEFEIVGVVNDTKYRSLREVPPPIFYTADFGPAPQYNSMVLHIRTSRDPRELIPAVRKMVASIDPRLPFYQATTLTDEIDRSLWQERMLVALATAFGIFAFALTAVGLYGILAYYIAGRRGEIGIRIALGALPVHIGTLLLKQLAVTIAVGLGAGAALSLAAGIWTRSLLYEVGPYDPRTIASALGSVIFIVFLAMAVPTWRVLRIDPAAALRQE